MVEPLTDEQEALLNRLYFTERLLFGVGRDKLFKYIRQHHLKDGIKRRQVAEWLKTNEINQLFRKRNEQKDLQRTVVKGPHKLVEIDLIDMTSKSSGGYNWILNGIDVFSKKAYSVALVSKSDANVLKGLKVMLKDMTLYPSAIRSDNGAEFTNKKFVDFADENNITLINGKPRTPQSQANVERFNGILKRLLEMYRVQFNDTKWEEYLQKVVNTYNNTWQRTINEVPNNIDREGGSDEVKQRIETSITPKNDNDIIQKFFVDDKVRILLEKTEIGGKSFRNWSDEIYTVNRVFVPRSETVYTFAYGLTDPDGKVIHQKFFQPQLQLVSEVNNAISEPKKYKVSSLVRALIKNGIPSYEVKWVGFRKKSDNTIEPREQLLADVPKMVKDYEEKHNVVWSNNKVTQT